MADEEAIRERAVRRIQLISYAREQQGLANEQLEEAYSRDLQKDLYVDNVPPLRSIAHSLAAIASLMLADKEVTP